ncbi:MAG TPA: FliG C-terminal domain-containing protein [Polyangia bacterium]
MPDLAIATTETNQPAHPVGPGTQRAAAVLLGLGPDLAAAVFPHLDEPSVRAIALGARELRKHPQAVPQALGAFVESLDLVGGDAAAGDEVLRNVAAQVLGVDAVRRAFDGVTPLPPADEVLGPIANADSETLAMILGREQPQTVALVLGAMDPTRAGEVMKHLPEVMRPQILRRLATLEAVAPEVLREVGQALQGELKNAVSSGMKRFDGKGAAVELLRRSPAAAQTEAVQEIEKEDPELAAELRTKLFTFQDLANLSDRDIQTFLREIDTSRLGVALKGAAANVREKILKNMSSRAAEMLADDIAAMGPVKLADVELAQGELVKIAFTLAEQGRISVVSPADKMV